MPCAMTCGAACRSGRRRESRHFITVSMCRPCRPARCRRAKAREILGLSADAWIVGNVGDLHPDKDQATLLDGFAAALPGLPAHSQLVILGSGRLEAGSQGAGARIGHWRPRAVPRSGTRGPTFISAPSMSLPLSSDHEPFGMVLPKPWRRRTRCWPPHVAGPGKWSKA